MKPSKKKKFTLPKMDNLGCQLFYSTLTFQIGMSVFLFVLSPPVYIAKTFYLMFGVLAIVIGFFYQQQRCQEKRENEAEKLIIQLRPSYRLISITACIFRELCDHLQIMSMMASIGKGAAIDIHIKNMADEMRILKYTGVENPVIASVILCHKILAREKGVDLIVFSNTTLTEYTSHLDLLEQIFDLSLKSLVENEITSRSKSRLILIDISETPDSYVIFLSVSEEAIQIFQSWEKLNLKCIALEFRQDITEKYNLVYGLIEKMGATSNFKTYGNFTCELTIWITK